jgi:cytochrome P450
MTLDGRRPASCPDARGSARHGTVRAVGGSCWVCLMPRGMDTVGWMALSRLTANGVDSGALSALPPGPRLPGPVQTLWYTFDQPGFWELCRKRYGPTFTNRLPGFPPVVVTGDRDAIRRLLTGDPLSRRHGNDLLRVFMGERSLLVLEPAEHLARRRLELGPFHGDAMRQYSDRIADVIAAEIANWRAGQVVATGTRARSLTLGVILELVLGVRDRGLREELASIFEWFASPLSSLGLFLPRAMTQRAWWNVLMKPAYARLDRVHRLLERHIMATRRDEALNERSDVLSLLVRATGEDGARLSDTDLRDELVTLVAAGHETTATAIAWACELLAHNPHVAERMRESVISGDRTYLKAAAKESLRARPLAYTSAARHVLEPIEIGEWVIGPEAVVAADAQGVHLDPELYPEPRAFRPERFLDGTPDSYAYIPFGGGAHRCLGAPLAMLELELFLEALVTTVEIEPAGAPARPVRRGPTLAPNNRGRVKVIRRRQAAGPERRLAPATA